MHSLRLLLIEDNPADVRLVRKALGDTSTAQVFVEHRANLEAGLRRIAKRGIDCVLLDLTLADSQGLDTFRRRSRGGAQPADRHLVFLRE